MVAFFVRPHPEVFGLRLFPPSVTATLDTATGWPFSFHPILVHHSSSPGPQDIGILASLRKSDPTGPVGRGSF